MSPSPAAARDTVCKSGWSNCLSSRAAGGLPIISKSAAAFSGPLSVLSPLIAASSMAILVRTFKRLSKSRAGDDLQERHAESLGQVVDDDNFAARDHRTVDDDVDGVADPLIKRDDRAASEFHE